MTFFPNRLFQPVQYGTKPEGRLATIANAVGQRPPTSSPTTSTSPSTTSQSGQTRGKSPVTTTAATPASHGMSISEKYTVTDRNVCFHHGYRFFRWCTQ